MTDGANPFPPQPKPKPKRPVCHRCGQRKASDGRKACGPCAAKENERSKEYYQRQSKRQKKAWLDKKRARRARRGWCSECGSRKRAEGLKRCSICVEKSRARRARRRKGTGRK